MSQKEDWRTSMVYRTYWQGDNNPPTAEKWRIIASSDDITYDENVTESRYWIIYHLQLHRGDIGDFSNSACEGTRFSVDGVRSSSSNTDAQNLINGFKSQLSPPWKSRVFNDTTATPSNKMWIEFDDFSGILNCIKIMQGDSGNNGVKKFYIQAYTHTPNGATFKDVITMHWWNVYEIHNPHHFGLYDIDLSKSCTVYQSNVSNIGNGICEPQYNNENCHWDGYDCEIPGYDGCFSSDITQVGNGVCNDDTNTAACGWDGGDCLLDTYPDCVGIVPFRIGNGICDNRPSEPYNTEECGWDGGDCVWFSSTALIILVVVGVFVGVTILCWSFQAYVAKKKRNNIELDLAGTEMPVAQEIENFSDHGNLPVAHVIPSRTMANITSIGSLELSDA